MSNPMHEPFSGESELYHYLTQETRYLIIQYILAHPENLPSLEELDYAIPKGRSTIHQHLKSLRERDIVDAYELDPEKRSRDLPSTFYGLTEHGIYVVEEFDLLKAKEMLQAIYANMDKPERVQRYEEAPRPERKSESELRQELDDLVVTDNEFEQPATMRKVTGIANLLEKGDTEGEKTDEFLSIRLELGIRILNLIESDSTEDREAAVSALTRVGKANLDVVFPVIPKLAEVVGELDLEHQLEVVDIFSSVSKRNPEQISDESEERLGELFKSELAHWEDDFGVAREILKKGLSISENIGSEELRAMCHDRLGDIAKRRGNLDEAEENYESSLAICRDLGNHRGRATSLNNLGLAAQSRGDLEIAQEYHEKSLEIAHEVGDRQIEANTLNNLGIVARMRGDLEAAKGYYQQSLEIAREVGDQNGEAKSLGNLGVVAQERGDLNAAQNYYENALEIKREIDDRYGEGQVLSNLGIVAQRRGDLEAAQEYHEKSLEIAREVSDRRGEAKTLDNLGVVAQKRGDLEVAQDYHQHSLRIEREVGNLQGEATSLKNLGLLAQRQGYLEVAQEYHEKSLEIAREIGDRQIEATSLNSLGTISQMRGDIKAAQEYYEKSLEIVHEIGDQEGMANTLNNLGVVARERGDLEAAKEYYQQSLEIGREVGDRQGEARLLSNLGVVTAETGDYEAATEQLIKAFEKYMDGNHIESAIKGADILAWLASRRNSIEEAIEWCDKGLDLIDQSPADLSELEDRLRTRKEEVKESNQPDLGSLYRTALRATASGEDDEATQLFREAWGHREGLDKDSEEYQISISAGVGLLAEITLLDIEETTDAEEKFTSEIEPDRDHLNNPADALFEFLTDENMEDIPDILTDAQSIEKAETLTDLETVAYAEILERLEEKETVPPPSDRPDSDAFDQMAQPEPQITSD
jgi:tetratricopeptide (TPR) repeat protein